MSYVLPHLNAHVSVLPSDNKETLFVVGIFVDNGKAVLTPSAALFDAQNHSMISRYVETGIFEAKVGQTQFLSQTEALPNGIALLGLGDIKAFNATVFKEAIEKSVTAFAWAKAQAYVVEEWLPSDLTEKESASLFATTTLNALIQRVTLKTQPSQSHKTNAIYWVSEAPSQSVLHGLKEGEVVAEGMAIMRYLAELPGNHCTPSFLANAVKEATEHLANISITILEKDDLQTLGMGAFLSVAQGSVEPPRLIAIQYHGTESENAPYALVGKGITFDAGGISLKPATNMADMTFDMSGAAAVIGTVLAVARAQLPINLLGVVAACENLPSGSAAKPGDVVTSLSGKTIEILNTDCEGRMVLADALTWTARQKPQCIVDAATLTGACCIALGAPYTGLFTSHDKLADELLKAGQTSLDLAWRLPVGPEYAKLMRTPVADIANQATVRDGGASSAAAFLSTFTEDIPWAHLDIAATANTSGRDRYSTGRPVPLLMRFLFNHMH